MSNILKEYDNHNNITSDTFGTNTGISNLDSINYIQMCLENLNALKESPLMMLQAKTDTFGVSLDVDSDAVLN